MKKSSELLVAMAVLFLFFKHGFTEKESPKILTIKSLDFGAKSCPDGYVHNKDYFVLTGSINITNINRPPMQANVMVYYSRRTGFQVIWETILMLWKVNCAEVRVRATSCRCMYKDDNEIRIKCNITMKVNYHSEVVVLNYVSDYFHSSVPSAILPKVYGNTSCLPYASYSKSQGSNLSGGTSAWISVVFTAMILSLSSPFSSIE